MARHRIFITLAVVAILTAACGGSTSVRDTDVTATSPIVTVSLGPGQDAPPGFGRYVDSENGFVMDVPEDWLQLGTGTDTIEDLIRDGADVADVDGDLVAQALAEIDGGVALILFNPADQGANVNVLRVDRIADISPGLYRTLVPSQMEQFGASNIETELVSLDAGDAVRATYRAAGLEGIQYTIFTKDDLWIITLTASSAARYSSVLDQMAASFGTA